MSQQFNSEAIFTTTVSCSSSVKIPILQVNGGKSLSRVTSNAYSLHFGSLSGHQTASTTVSFSGAVIAQPNFSIVSTPTTVDPGIVFCANTIADNVIRVRAHNTANSSQTAATATYDVLLIQFDS
jgi:hypothetical protein